MAAKKEKKAVQAYNWKKNWVLHNPEDWVILIVALMGFANLMPNVSLGQMFNYAWPIIITAVFLYKLGKRKNPE